MPHPHPTPEAFATRVRDVVARIPAGHVATYGQIAALAGYPRRARHVGQVLAGLPAGSRLPWHRVINAQGRVSVRAGSGGPDSRQQRLLRKEGVPMPGGRVNLQRYRWRPEEEGAWVTDSDSAPTPLRMPARPSCGASGSP